MIYIPLLKIDLFVPTGQRGTLRKLEGKRGVTRSSDNPCVIT
jgi:hypothetical protein